MPITLNCPKCRKPFRVRDESVGLRVKCPTCSAILQVPANQLPASKLADSAGGSLAGSSPGSAPGMTRTARPVGESLLGDLPASNPHAGPPSLQIQPTQPMRRSPLEDDNAAGQNRRGGATGPLPATRRAAPSKAKPVRKRTDEMEDPEQIAEDASAWRGVRSGLRWIQFGLLCALIYRVGQLAVTVFCYTYYNALPDEVVNRPAGLLGKKGIDLFQEIGDFTLFASALLLLFFASIGLLKCLRVPQSARTKGTVFGTLLFLWISVVGFIVVNINVLHRYVELAPLPKEVSRVALQSFGRTGELEHPKPGKAGGADAKKLEHADQAGPWAGFPFLPALAATWFLVFLMQTSIPLQSSKLAVDIAYSALLVIVFLLGIDVVNNYYPLKYPSPNIPKDDRELVYVIDKAIFAVTAMLIALRLMAIAGIVRRSVRRWLENNEPA